MCFDTSDADWMAAVEITLGACDRVLPRRCFDCGNVIDVGEWHLRVEQWQYEWCRRCEWEDSEPCEGEHDYGEHFLGRICRRCCQARHAIEVVELAAGCAASESQPFFGELQDAMSEDSRYGAGRYAAKLLELYGGEE